MQSLLDLYLENRDVKEVNITEYLRQNCKEFESIYIRFTTEQEELYKMLNKKAIHKYEDVYGHMIDLADLRLAYVFAEGFITCIKTLLNANEIIKIEEEE